MLLRIKKVKYLENYKLKLFFSDNKVKVFDFEAWIQDGKGYLAPLKNIAFFKTVRIDDCQYTICWPNGADFCPDVLYEMGEEVDGLKQTPSTGKKATPARRSRSSTSKAA